jgi:hypothetical protein
MPSSAESKGLQIMESERSAAAAGSPRDLRDKPARKLEEHADELVVAYSAGIRSDDPNRAYRAADAWNGRFRNGSDAVDVG